jgi:Outer membrane lipoprotein-sorting protein
MNLTPTRKSLTRIAAWTLAPAAAAGLVFAAPVLAETPSALSAVQAHLKNTSSMTADFVQTDRKGQRLSGTLTLKRPGKIRFQYQKGVPLLIVGDGSRLTMIDYEVKQVQSWPVKNSPLGALLDPDRDLSKYAKVLPTGSDGVISVEVKDPKRPEYGTITMVFLRDGSAQAGCACAAGSRSTRRTTAPGSISAIRSSTSRLPIPPSAGPTRARRPAGANRFGSASFAPTPVPRKKRGPAFDEW